MNARQRARGGSLMLFILAPLLVARAQVPVFRASVDAVRIDVAVTRGGKPVQGLRAEDFDVRDNGVPQRVSLAQTSAGVHVVLVLDVSGSVKGDKLGHLKAGARALVGALQEHDSLTLLTFSERLACPVVVSHETGAILPEIDRVEAGGRTALYDAMYAGLALASAHDAGRSLLMVFSDGHDNASWLSAHETTAALKRGDHGVYVVAPSESWSPLGDIAAKTGGQLYRAEADARLGETFVRVLNLFRGGYVLTFSPEGVGARDGWHTLKVQLRGKHAGQVRAREGYYAR